MDNNYQQETGTIFPQFHTPHYEAAADQLGFIDFTDEANFDQFVDLISCVDQNYNHIDDVPIFSLSHHPEEGIYDHHKLNLGSACDADGGHFYPPAVPPLEVFDFDIAMGQLADVKDCDVSVEKDRVCEEVDILDREESSGTTAPAAAAAAMINDLPAKKKGGKVDRSRTLISERTRRGKMKEKLYALRSLVPNITKMDKASIVGDAVLYVQDLQIQAKKLRADIAGLETTLALLDKDQTSTTQNANKITPTTTTFYPLPKKIFKMDVFQMEERGFYARIASNKGRDVAASLYKAIESFTGITVQSSNLTASADNYVLTFSMHIMGEVKDVSLSNVKLLIATTFLNQGFDFETSQIA